jgi:hypothetical protein
MNRDPESDFLLGEVLSEGDPADFRETLLATTLGMARRRRIFKRARRISGALLLIGAFAFFGWHNPTRERGPSRPTLGTLVFIETRPLPPLAIVRTVPLEPGQVTVSVPFSRTVRTSREMFHLINDRELLALASPRPAVLIASGTPSEELEFVDAADGTAVRSE